MLKVVPERINTKFLYGKLNVLASWVYGSVNDEEVWRNLFRR